MFAHINIVDFCEVLIIYFHHQSLVLNDLIPVKNQLFLIFWSSVELKEHGSQKKKTPKHARAKNFERDTLWSSCFKNNTNYIISVT
jgi:hypothetical protein